MISPRIARTNCELFSCAERRGAIEFPFNLRLLSTGGCTGIYSRFGIALSIAITTIAQSHRACRLYRGVACAPRAKRTRDTHNHTHTHKMQIGSRRSRDVSDYIRIREHRAVGDRHDATRVLTLAFPLNVWILPCRRVPRKTTSRLHARNVH